MNKGLVKAVARRLASHVPVVRRALFRSTGGTGSARYCYSVWLRHLVLARGCGLRDVPRSVAELGPGDSLGIGLAALLSGTNQYVALDVKRYATNERNASILDALRPLFEGRSPIPGEDEFPRLAPAVSAYAFPATLLGDETLSRALAPDRIARIRRALAGHETTDVSVSYAVPWQDATAVVPESIDMAYSQAVLEHVADLDATYGALFQWLRPGGFMSHEIDFRSHGLSSDWGGHWTYSRHLWSFITRTMPWSLNRAPLSDHLRLLEKHGFVIRRCERVAAPTVSRRSLAREFAHLSDDDLATASAFIQAQKP